MGVRRDDVTEEWLREVYARYEAGEKSLKELAAEIGWTYSRLYYYLHTRGVRPQRKGCFGLQNMPRHEALRISRAGVASMLKNGSKYQFTKAELRRNGKKGGHVAWVRETAHRWTSEEAKAASRKGKAVLKAKAAARKAAREQAALEAKKATEGGKDDGRAGRN